MHEMHREMASHQGAQTAFVPGRIKTVAQYDRQPATAPAASKSPKTHRQVRSATARRARAEKAQNVMKGRSASVVTAFGTQRGIEEPQRHVVEPMEREIGQRRRQLQCQHELR